MEYKGKRKYIVKVVKQCMKWNTKVKENTY